MTKVEALKKVMEDNKGTASLDIIYGNIEKYYPDAKKSKAWEAGLRGVLYREIKAHKNFKKIGLSIYALADYVEQETPKPENKIRMHSYIEGICLELGNEQNFKTYTADFSAEYRDNICLKDLVSLKQLPEFTYKDILNDVKRIDVLWFNRSKYAFPQFAFEVVDSIGTLNSALNRCLQLQNFRTKFFILAPEKHREKFEQTLELQIYENCRNFFVFKNYDEILKAYEHLVGGKHSLAWLR